MAGISLKKKNMLILMVILLTALLIWLVINAYDKKIKQIEEAAKPQPITKLF